MTNSYGSDELAMLVANGPRAVKSWLAEVEVGQQWPSGTFNWLGLAELAASKARSGQDLEWAEIAIGIYTQLGNKVESPTRKEYLMYSQMNLRAYFITRFGAISGHPTLDPQPIIDWFISNLSVSVEEALEQSSHWTELDIDSTRKLRWIKNRLYPIQLLKDAGMLPKDSDLTLSRWLEIRSRLP